MLRGTLSAGSSGLNLETQMNPVGLPGMEALSTVVN